MSNNVIVFTLNGCGHCVELKKELKNLSKKNDLLIEQLKRIESEIKKNKENPVHTYTTVKT